MVALPEFGLSRFARMALLVALAGLAIAIEAAPLGLAPGAPPSPDLVYAVIAHGALTAPALVPVLLVFAVGLARDLLTDLPVGLGALSLVLAAEVLRARAPMLRRQPLLTQWSWVGGVAAAMLFGQWLVLTLTLAPVPPLLPVIGQLAVTLAVYPIVTIALGWVLRAHRGSRLAEPGERS